MRSDSRKLVARRTGVGGRAGGGRAAVACSDLPLVAITMGDPAGIGPEVALKAAHDPRVRAVALPVLLGDAEVFRRVAGRRGRPPAMGRPSRAGGLAAVLAIRAAVDLCLAGEFDGMVTAPVSKESLALAGEGLIGHTELIARLTGCTRYAMLMKNRSLRVVLATTHVPLAAVAGLITVRDLAAKIDLAAEYLRLYAGLRAPRIAVCGLNPHAGEGGRLGTEERRLIEPAIKRARRPGLRVDGPLSADSVFRPGGLAGYDAILAMYHDQGIIPVKMGDPGEVVNVTLGIPLIRTSPGHGTAFDIAGRGTASSESMVSAVLECAAMVRARAGRRR